MEKRIRVIKGAGSTTLLHEMAGDRIINQIFVMNRHEAAELYSDLDRRYGFTPQLFDKFPTDIFKEPR